MLVDVVQIGRIQRNLNNAEFAGVRLLQFSPESVYYTVYRLYGLEKKTELPKPNRLNRSTWTELPNSVSVCIVTTVLLQHTVVSISNNTHVC